MGVSKKLKMAMIDKDIKQKTLAESLGYTNLNSLYNALNRDSMTFTTAEKWADAIGCDIVLRDRTSGKIYGQPLKSEYRSDRIGRLLPSFCVSTPLLENAFAFWGRSLHLHPTCVSTPPLLCRCTAPFADIPQVTFDCVHTALLLQIDRHFLADLPHL